DEALGPPGQLELSLEALTHRGRHRRRQLVHIERRPGRSRGRRGRAPPAGSVGSLPPALAFLRDRSLRDADLSVVVATAGQLSFIDELPDAPLGYAEDL